MTALEIIWLVATLAFYWWTYVWIRDEYDVLIIIPVLLSLMSTALLIYHFIDTLTTPLW